LLRDRHRIGVDLEGYEITLSGQRYLGERRCLGEKL
jgi:hypothetical protein